MVQAFVTRSGKSEAEIRILIEDTETWLPADEAVDAGLADEILKHDAKKEGCLDRVGVFARELVLMSISD